MQVKKFRGSRRVLTGERMGRDVVDLCVADPHVASVVKRLEVVLTRSQHCRLRVLDAPCHKARVVAYERRW